MYIDFPQFRKKIFAYHIVGIDYAYGLASCSIKPSVHSKGYAQIFIMGNQLYTRITGGVFCQYGRTFNCRAVINANNFKIFKSLAAYGTERVPQV